VKGKRANALLGLVLCAAAQHLRAAPPEPSPLYGRVVTAIAFDPPEQPLQPAQMRLSVGLRAGDRLSEIKLGEAIEGLYATGRYEDIVVEGEPAGDGVALTFHTIPRYFLSRISVDEIPAPPSSEQLSGAAALTLGEAYDEDGVTQAMEHMEALLRANGFYGAQIRYVTQKRDQGEEVELRFIIQPGRRAHFAAPLVEGETQFPSERIIRETSWRALASWQGWGWPLWRWHQWREMTDARLQRGLEQLRALYSDKGYLMAAVRLAELNHDAAANTVAPRLVINAGPRIIVRTEGVRVGRGTLRRVLPIYQERSFDNELLAEGVHSLQDYFNSEGYFQAKVSYTLQPAGEGDSRMVVYRVERGARSRFTRIEIRGNHYFSTATLRARMSLTPAELLRSWRGVYSDSLLQHDLAEVQELYRSKGFRDVKVTSSMLFADQGKPHNVAVALKIEEGRQIFVGQLELTGVEQEHFAELMRLVSLKKGQPFSTSSMAVDRDAILGHYFNHGYPEASFDAQVKPGADDDHVNLQYVVQEGRREFTRGVLLNGLETTRQRLVGPRIAIKAGQPLSQGAIVETQRRLYDLGIFTNVDVAVQNPEGQESDKNVVLQVDEARRYTFDFGLGAEIGRIGGGETDFNAPAGAAGFSPRVLLGVSRSNLFGLDQSLSLTGRVSTIQQRALLSYLAPRFQGHDNLNLSFSALFDRSSDIRTFTSKRFEGSVQLSHKLSRLNLLQYRVAVRQVSIDANTLKISPALIPIYSVPVRETILSATWVQDRRDDPLESTRGTYNSVDFGIAPPLLGAGTAYTRLVVKNSSYHRIAKDVILARSVSFGWLYNLSGNPVPLPERFFGGGNTTDRGFPENQAGPRDPVTGFPLGGDAFLFFNTELRFPLMGKTLGGVLFHDMGNVYSGLDNLSFRVSQHDRQDFDYMVHSVGLGFRYRTPVGPVRLDFGYGLNPPRFVGYPGTREDLLNSSPPYPTVPLRVSPFQFFFSLGQTF
jgi:outer membrane protein assembly complex protein YaeT